MFASLTGEGVTNNMWSVLSKIWSITYPTSTRHRDYGFDKGVE